MSAFGWRFTKFRKTEEQLVMRAAKQYTVVTVLLALSCLVPAVPGQTYDRYGQNSNRYYDRQQVGQLLARLEPRALRFQNMVQRAIDQSRLDDTQREDRINQLMSDFRLSLTQLRARYNRRQETDADVQRVLERASQIDSVMTRRQALAIAQSDWQLIRSDLDRLAGVYNIAWNWENVGGPVGRGYSDARLTGTFQLNSRQSDDARLAIERAVRGLPYDQRQRASDILLRRVAAPEMLAIERHGRTISLASSRARQMTFDADGIEHTEQFPNSQRVSRTTANIVGDGLTITTSGNRDTDFIVAFDPINNGRQLRVTRS